MSENTYCGIDVAKEHLVVALINQDDTITFKNDEKGIKAMIRHLKQFPAHVALLEATGGLEQAAALALHKADWQVIIANPRKAASFIRSQENAKTDSSDAKLLARYARNLAEDSAKPVSYFTPPDPKRAVLEALVKRRSELIEMRVAEQNRQDSAHAQVKGDIKRSITMLNKHIAKLEERIEKACAPFRELIDRICAIKGVGRITAAVLLSMMPELGEVNGKRIASLAGVAPHACDSGKLKGQRFCWGGRAEVRQALYMATLTAVRYEPTFREHYQQLLARGKAKKVALVACMRKLLVCINTLLREKVEWNPQRYLSVKEHAAAA